ncbi:MAG: ABC transporter ATP-binding protein [Myxococcota bacterium]
MTPALARLVAGFRSELGWLAVGVSGSIVASGANVAAPVWLAEAIDRDLATGDADGLGARAASYAGAVAVALLATLGSRVALEIASQRALRRLKVALFDHLVEHDVALHDQIPSGSLIGRVQGDVEALRILFVEVLFALPADAVLVVGMLAVTEARAHAVAGPVFAVLPAWLVLFGLFRWVAPPYFQRQRVAVSALTGALADAVRGLPALRALGRHHWVAARLRDSAEDARRADLLAQFQPIWYFNGAQLVRSVAIAALLVWGGARLADGTATVGVLVMGLSYLRQLFQPLLRLSNHLATLERARASATRIVDLLDTPRRVADAARPVPWPGLRQALRFEQVGFAYTPGTEVLCALDLTVPAGTRVGVIGATGSGKSTVVDLALRFRDPVSGRITVDGVDLRSIDRASLRAHTALVLQEVRLLPGTVLENLGGDPTLAKKALDAIGSTFPLERVIDERALSRGERQLLTFARALVGDPELLVLDEATSAVDPTTEREVQRALDQLMSGRTVLVIAHRLHTVRGCDTLYVLDRGRVVEHGPPATLLAAGGAYARLVREQGAAS